MFGTGKSRRRLHRLTSIFVLFAAAFVVLSFAAAASNESSLQSEKSMLAGEVIAVDHVHNLQTLTLRSDEIGQFPSGNKLNIYLTPKTEVVVCDRYLPAKDITVNSNATVTYHEERGLAVADSIAEQC